MECRISQAFPSDSADVQPGQSPPKAVLHVNFALDSEEAQERKKKYLTAKYGQHQMSLIKKRLRVEMWMYDQLQLLYNAEEKSENDVEIDLDELLDIETESARQDWLRNKLIKAKKPKDVIEIMFVDPHIMSLGVSVHGHDEALSYSSEDEDLGLKI